MTSQHAVPALATVDLQIVATGYVAVCRGGGLWAVGRTADEALASAKAVIADSVRSVPGADKLVRGRPATPGKSVLEDPPAEDEVVAYLTTERVIRYMTEESDGCVTWCAFGPIIDFQDDPMVEPYAHPPVNRWTNPSGRDVR
jgi:hypothetical protein